MVLFFDFMCGVLLKIVIIGGGILGLLVVWLLLGYYQVMFYESVVWLGGYVCMVMVGWCGDVVVDIGFIVFNYVNYLYFLVLFCDFDVFVQCSDMSFGVLLGNGWVEYVLCLVGVLFVQCVNFMCLGFYCMICDILCFNVCVEVLVKGQFDLIIGQLIVQMWLGDWFCDDYLYLICGVIWFILVSQIGDFLVEMLL